MVACALALALTATACGETHPPAPVQVLVLRGTPYQRGLQHGQALGARIRSLYTTLLTNSLLPYLDRERPDVASVLNAYTDDPDDGFTSYYEDYREQCLATCQSGCRERCSFSYLLMRDSAERLQDFIPAELLEEMRGVADGAGLPFETVLILNTFYDTLLSFRAITAFIKGVQAPRVVSLAFVGGLESDGVDNDGDGQVDQAGEGSLPAYEPSAWALMREVPPGARVEVLLEDIKLSVGVDKGDQPGVDPATVRVQLDEVEHRYPLDPAVEVQPVEGNPQQLRVIFTPPGGLAPAAAHSLVVRAGDFNRIVNPPPEHARFMRDERVTFTTAGDGRALQEVPNRGLPDGVTQPTAFAFAARGGATVGGAPLLAEHYALLDADTVHKHAVLFVHVPDQGAVHAVLGYAGVLWGFSGMNAEGLALALTHSDTLDNSMAGGFFQDLFDARLAVSGVPIGLALREVLAGQSAAPQAADLLARVRHTFGWNLLLADAAGEVASLEVDAGLGGEPATGPGVEWAQGDLALQAAHFARNLDDIRRSVLVFDVKPQRCWSTFFFRSLRTLSTLARLLSERVAPLDAAAAMQVLGSSQVVDSRDSMNAPVYLPAERALWFAAGAVPATSLPFQRLDLAPFAAGQGAAP
jgi:hypothetical protein